MLSFAFELSWVIYNLLLDSNLYFCDFGLYLEFNIILDYIQIYLDFNQNYNLVFFFTVKKIAYFF